jgi:hypothetical protein
MHINITKSETGNNKGSSSQWVAYLEKENRLTEKLDQYHQPEYWFSRGRNNIQPYEVRQSIEESSISLMLTPDLAPFTPDLNGFFGMV